MKHTIKAQRNDVELNINIKTELEITKEVKTMIIEAICNDAFWMELDSEGIVAMDMPISPKSTYWLVDIKNNVCFNENDIPFRMDIKCTLFDNKKYPDMESIKKAKIYANALFR